MMELLGENVCNHIVGNPEVKYVLQNCPRCLGKGTYGDIVFDNEGHIKTITGISQLKQQLKKIIIENTRDTGYGFNYNLISFVNDVQLLAIKKELNRCIEYLSNTQVKEQREGFYYSNTELLDSIEEVNVERNVDVRSVDVTIYCKTVSGRDAIINIPLER